MNSPRGTTLVDALVSPKEIAGTPTYARPPTLEIEGRTPDYGG